MKINKHSNKYLCMCESEYMFVCGGGMCVYIFMRVCVWVCVCVCEDWRFGDLERSGIEL